MGALDKLKAFIAAHKKQVGLGAAGAAVAALAYVRARRRAGDAAGGVLVSPVAGQADVTANDAYGQFTSAIESFAAQQQTSQQNVLDQIGGALTAQSQYTGQATDYLAAQQQSGLQSLADMIMGLFDQGAAEPASPVAPRAGTQGTYTFTGTESIADVAAKYGITAQQLLAANSKSGPNFTAAGHKITIPTAAAAPVSAAPNIRYTFKDGESYATVAARYGLTEAQLRAMNPTAGANSGKAGTSITIRGV